MIKPLTLIALAGALGTPSFAQQLKSGAALPPELIPAVAEPIASGGDGGGDPQARAGRPPWDDSDVKLFYVGHNHRYEGGEGGEGGEGRRHSREYEYEYEYEREGGEGGEGHVGRRPAYTGPPIIAIPCGSREHAGTLLGAALGGLVGSQFGKGDGQLAAVAAGTFLGMFLGRDIGRMLDVTDEGCARDAAQRAGRAPLGTRISWNNPRTGHSGTVTPLREGQTSGGQYCREYQQTVTVGGQVQEAYGRACRQPDGSWKIVQ